MKVIKGRLWTRGRKTIWVKASPRIARFARNHCGKLVSGTAAQPAYRSRVVINSELATRGLEAGVRLAHA